MFPLIGCTGIQNFIRFQEIKGLCISLFGIEESEVVGNITNNHRL